MKLLKSDLKKLSYDVKLNISDEYIDLIYDNFLPIVEQLEHFKKINLSSIKPLDRIHDEASFSYLRDDDNPIVLNKDDVLRNAMFKNKDFF